MAYGDFDTFAGQLVQDGMRTGYPAVDLEVAGTRAIYDALPLIEGLLPKIAKTLIRETRVHGNPLEPIFRKGSLPFGVGMEQAAFEVGASNKKLDGTCIPNGPKPTMQNQLDLINFAWDFQLLLKDRAVHQQVTDAQTAGRYQAEFLRTTEKSRALMKYRQMTQLISDVIDGTRSISSTTVSDGTGTSVTYAPTITGYCATSAIMDSGVLLPALVQGTIPSISVSDTVTMLENLQNAATEMREDSPAYSKLGISTFVEEKPNLIMESKVLNAMDSAIMAGASQRLPTRTAREFVNTFADLVEIESFADLPTNAGYSDKRLAAVLLDKDQCTEQIQYDAAEAGRCYNEMATGFVYQGASLLSVWRGGPAAALLVNTV